MQTITARLTTLSRVRWVMVAGAIMALSACASDLEESLSCPNVTLLKDTQTLTRMAGTGVAFEAKILSAVGTCDYDLDDDTKTGKLEAKVTATFQVTRGQTLQANAVSFDYYVAITNPYGEVLNKGVFSVPAALEKGKPGLTVEDDPIHLSIPLKTASLTTHADKNLHIIVGFQLSPNELDYNRKRLGR